LNLITEESSAQLLTTERSFSGPDKATSPVCMCALNYYCMRYLTFWFTLAIHRSKFKGRGDRQKFKIKGENIVAKVVGATSSEAF